MGAPSSFEVPIIDISPYARGGGPGDRSAVAEDVDRACSEVGFMQIRGHGIDIEVIERMGRAFDDFFALDIDEKKRFRDNELNRGYSPPKSESLSRTLGIDPTNDLNDYFEAFNIGSQTTDYPGVDLPEDLYGPNIWPGLGHFRGAVTAYFGEVQRVTADLLRLFADALGLRPDYFTKLSRHPIQVMRMNNYALPEGTRTAGSDPTGMGEHTDFGLLTVLWADAVPGLQVLGKDSVWHDVTPAEGCLLVNLGDLTARITNDRWLSTLHRVAPPIVNDTIVRRRSVAFFHHGDPGASISPCPEVESVEPTEGYDSVLVADHVRAKLAGSRRGRTNKNTSRETERALAAKGDPAV